MLHRRSTTETFWCLFTRKHAFRGKSQAQTQTISLVPPYIYVACRFQQRHCAVALRRSGSICDVYVNGEFACHHEGGYNSFSVNITAFLKEENTLTVRVRDFTDTSHYTNGKQSSHRKGMWYTPQSGIWQTVWLESVPTQYIKSVRITPNFDRASVTVEADCNFDEPITVIVCKNGEELCKADGKKFVTVQFPDARFHAWSPEDPYLYDLKIVSRRDMVESYFGMRKFSVKNVDGVLRLMLNNKPYFHNGLLDQGYWSDGLYTAPTDEAMIFDISQMKSWASTCCAST